jgi:DNA-directed RNA polymerase specialized sigma24 family protein
MIENLSRSQLIALIDEWIVGRNGERNRAILKRRLIDGLTYEQIAEEFDLSVRQTKTIIYKEEQKLIKHL